MNITERKPVIYVPNHVKEQMLETHSMWLPILQFAGSDKRIIQQMLDLQLRGSSPKWATQADLLDQHLAVGGIELGIVSSWNEKWVLVKYHPSLHRTGWDITAQATSREDLFERNIVVEDRPFIQGAQKETDD